MRQEQVACPLVLFRVEFRRLVQIRDEGEAESDAVRRDDRAGQRISLIVNRLREVAGETIVGESLDGAIRIIWKNDIQRSVGLFQNAT